MNTYLTAYVHNILFYERSKKVFILDQPFKEVHLFSVNVLTRPLLEIVASVVTKTFKRACWSQQNLVSILVPSFDIDFESDIIIQSRNAARIVEQKSQFN